jgi:hypothetical protein
MESKMKKEVFILCPEPPEQLGGVEACVREQVRGFSKRGFDVRVFHKKNSGSAFYLRNAHRLSHHFTDTLVGFFVGRTAQKAMHEGVPRFFRIARWGGIRCVCRQAAKSFISITEHTADKRRRSDVLLPVSDI